MKKTKQIKNIKYKLFQRERKQQILLAQLFAAELRQGSLLERDACY